ncbi:hypothetical protein BGZ99_007912, partial [Dissophora globulifera]
MSQNDERRSLVRSHNSNNGYTTGNGYLNNDDHAYPSRTPAGPEDFARRDPRTFLAQVQRGLAPFQAWAARVLDGGEESSVVNWVQNTRVARTFMMIINVILAVSAFVLMGVEMVEMALREPILDYLLPESETTLIAAGLTIVAGAFGFAVAYNLLVEEDPTSKGDGRDNDDHRGSYSGGNGRGSGPRTPNNDPPLVPQQQQQQQTRRHRLMFTKASTYLLNGNAVFLAVVLIVFTIAIMRRSVHLSRMDGELNDAWTQTNRHRKNFISDFELRHRCCGYHSISDRPFPSGSNPDEPTCSVHKAYGFKVPCKADLTKDFERWQKGIQHLLLAQMAML